MYLIILAVAIFILSISLSTIIVPATVREVIQDLLKKKWIWTLSVIRIILGICFLTAAKECSMPLFVTIMGGILIIAGVLLPVLGKMKVELMTQKWLNQKDWIIRIWGFFGMLFGITLALAGMPV